MNYEYVLETRISVYFKMFIIFKGVSYLNRKLIVNIRPQVVLLNEGKRWESKTYTSLRNTHKIYFDGEEFDEGIKLIL